ncbi:MAG TPA: ATP-dependent protease ATPase subunit HslU [Candidatus Goldiibacteriota bacterium]|nr:ATP-dependent protease ATPase subunit HslU [Candidatus Goldiibacteriota bacterium]
MREQNSELTPKQIVEMLDKFIVGQDAAKKAVAVALRNRIRRQRLPKDLQEEVIPKNILMIGPTGVGKTEIARRLAKIVRAPFLKVEASKYTEVGYVGRDVESMIRDLVKISVNMVKEEYMEGIKDKVEDIVEERLLDLLVPSLKQNKKNFAMEEDFEKIKEEKEQFNDTREKMKQMLLSGQLEDRQVEMNIKEKSMPMVEVFAGSGMDEIGINMQSMMEGIAGTKVKRKKITIKEAREIIRAEELQKMIDMDNVVKEAIEKTENTGIIFIDEIDKIASNVKSQAGPDVSREGVQRDLLPIVEGTTVITRYGPVNTDHILFIAAGAFHISKPSDLIPELQGRFPIRVELSSLSQSDFERILKEPENSLIMQYTKLLDVDDVNIQFEEESISEIAKIAFEINESMENIGARRLHTIMEKVLEDILFEAPYGKKIKKEITKEYVRGKLKDFIENRDLSKYIL